MAPELMIPENFGFIGELAKLLPTKSTDIYAIGMTILEVRACLYPPKTSKTSSQ
jgi:serine/threonine protein kinase